MKYILLLLFLFPLTGFAQDSVCLKRIDLAGQELEKFSKAHNKAILLEYCGVAVAGTGAIISINHKPSPVIYVGVGLTLVGWLSELNSFPYIRTAGWALRGLELDVPIKSKKNHNHDRK